MIPKVRIPEALALFKEKTGVKMKKIELAEKIKFNGSISTVENYLQMAIIGRKDLPCSILSQVSIILGVSTDYLLGLSEEPDTIEISSKRLCKTIDRLKIESDEMIKSFF